jgi:flavin reductase (DIM6/NTAB) family NADH-FMN oxidoreductase RutF
MVESLKLDFKDAMSSWASGVAIVSCRDSNANYCGITISSFTSLSLDPPLILVCLGNSSSTLLSIKHSKKFAVSILNESQEHIASLCAKKLDNKFSHFDYSIGEHSFSPLVDGALCWVECELDNLMQLGDHHIIVGKVLAAKLCSNNNPLLYYSRGYRKLEL